MVRGWIGRKTTGATARSEEADRADALVEPLIHDDACPHSPSLPQIGFAVGA
jgi:hypothetical protein